MIKAISALAITTAICGFLAVTPANAATEADAGAAAATATVSSTVTNTRFTVQDVSKIQKILADKGFYKSKVDGQFGQGTQDAMREYQSSEGLEANGYPTAATLEKLGVTPENPPVTGNAEPAGKGGVIYTETIDHKDVAERKTTGSNFANVDSSSQNGGTCLHCTNGPIGNGGTPSMHSNAF